MQNFIGEGAIQSALVEVSSNQIVELTNQNVLLQANLLACQNAIRTLQLTINDLNEEHKILKQSKDGQELTSKEAIEKLVESDSKLEMKDEEIANLKMKIETGYKAQIRELKEKLEAANGDNNTNQKESNK